MKKLAILAISMMMCIMCCVPEGAAMKDRERDLIEVFKSILDQKEQMQIKILDLDRELLRIEGRVLEIRKAEKDAEEGKVPEGYEAEVGKNWTAVEELEQE